jgi:NAD(P)H-hydrate epimerase
MSIISPDTGTTEMKRPALTRAQVREVDRIAIEQYAIPSIVLMENAGIGATTVIDVVAPSGKIVIICGSGNNGGDGYVIARHLEILGHDVRIIALTEPTNLKGDAKTNAIIAVKSGIEIVVAQDVEAIRNALRNAGTIVDGMLGTGAAGPLRGLYLKAVDACNASDALRVALDIPTGLDCDSGEPSDSTFLADHTITFVAEKVGFANETARSVIGQVHVVPIGVPNQLLSQFDIDPANPS